MSEQEHINAEFNITHTFIKDLSFEYKTEELVKGAPINVNISVNSKSRDLEEGQFEVLLFLNVSILGDEKKNEIVKFQTIYGGLFVAKGLPDDFPEQYKNYMLHFDGGSAIWTYAANLLDDCLIRAGLQALNLKCKDYRVLLNQSILNQQAEQKTNE